LGTSKKWTSVQNDNKEDIAGGSPKGNTDWHEDKATKYLVHATKIENAEDAAQSKKYLASPAGRSSS
jgi:hypothetical protein